MIGIVDGGYHNDRGAAVVIVMMMKDKNLMVIIVMVMVALMVMMMPMSNGTWDELVVEHDLANNDQDFAKCG